MMEKLRKLSEDVKEILAEMEKDAPELLEMKKYETEDEYEIYLGGLLDGARWAFSWVYRRLMELEGGQRSEG